MAFCISPPGSRESAIGGRGDTWGSHQSSSGPRVPRIYLWLFELMEKVSWRSEMNHYAHDGTGDTGHGHQDRHQHDGHRYRHQHSADHQNGLHTGNRDQELRTAQSQPVELCPWHHRATLEFPPRWHIEALTIAFRRLQAFADSLSHQTQRPVPWLGAPDSRSPLSFTAGPDTDTATAATHEPLPHS